MWITRLFTGSGLSLRHPLEVAVSAQAQKRAPEPETATPAAEAPTFAPPSRPLPTDPTGSPARRMQWELFRRIEGAEPAADTARYPAPVRASLLIGGGIGAWALVFAATRWLLSGH